MDFPLEIVAHILEYLEIRDLVRVETTGRVIQSLCHYEIERRLRANAWKYDLNVLVHLDQVVATPVRFDRHTKEILYTLAMKKPIEIKAMIDHQRRIQCSLLQRDQFRETFEITLKQDMEEGQCVNVEGKGDYCQVTAALTRKETKSTIPSADNIKHISSSPITFTLSITEMRLPLSAVAAM